MDRLERNKKNVIAFYDLMFNQCKPAEAIETYAGDTYIKHNPGDRLRGYVSESKRFIGPSLLTNGGIWYPFTWGERNRAARGQASSAASGMCRRSTARR